MSTQSLRKDHKLIEKVLQALDATIKLLKDGKQIPEEILSPTLDFTQNFTDNVSDLGVIKGSLFSLIFGTSDRFLGTGLRQDTVKKNPLRDK